MKKIFLFAAAALLSISMFADNISCADAKAKIDASDKGEYTVEGYVTEIIDVANPIYANVTFWMADKADGGQVFEVYRLSFKGKDAADIPVVGDKVAVTATLKKYNSTYETDKIKSYSIVAKGTGERYTDADLTVAPITVAEALTIANALSPASGSEAVTKKFYEITGYVVKIKSAYSEQYKNMTFYMADTKDAKDNIQAYQARVNAKVGDKVKVSGYLSNYAGDGFNSISIKGGAAEIVEEQAIENVSFQGAKAMKVMENGQLYIIRNGVKYNAAGAVVE